MRISAVGSLFKKGRRSQWTRTATPRGLLDAAHELLALVLGD
jgi:hypothetical protein